MLGQWSREDDGSGLWGIWGWALSFAGNGTGRAWNWGPEPDDQYEYTFEWRRTGPRQIALRTASGAWQEVHYRISAHRSRYGRPQQRLIDVDAPPTRYSAESFWGFPEPLFRPRTWGPFR